MSAQAVGPAVAMAAPSSATASERWLFSRALDGAMVTVPLVVTLGAFLLSGGDLGQSPFRAYAAWGSQFLLGNTTHVVLTFLLLGARRDVLTAAPRQARTVIVGSTLVWAAAVALYWAVDRFAPPMMGMLEAILFTLAAHHTFSQSKGLWALYAMRAPAAPSERERRFQRTYVPLGLSLVMVRWLFVANGQGRRFPFVGAVPGLEAPLPYAVTFALALVWLGFAVATVREVARSAGGYGAPKARFVAASAFGVLLMVLIPGWGSVLTSGMHGMEYFLLSRRMLSPYPDERTSLGPRLVVPAMLVAILPLFVVGLATGPFVSHPSPLATLAMWASNGIVLAHYFADAFIYRFRIPEVRRVALARLGYGAPEAPRG